MHKPSSAWQPCKSISKSLLFDLSLARSNGVSHAIDSLCHASKFCTAPHINSRVVAPLRNRAGSGFYAGQWPGDAHGDAPGQHGRCQQRSERQSSQDPLGIQDLTEHAGLATFKFTTFMRQERLRSGQQMAQRSQARPVEQRTGAHDVISFYGRYHLNEDVPVLLSAQYHCGQQLPGFGVFDLLRQLVKHTVDMKVLGVGLRIDSFSVSSRRRKQARHGTAVSLCVLMNRLHLEHARKVHLQHSLAVLCQRSKLQHCHHHHHYRKDQQRGKAISKAVPKLRRAAPWPSSCQSHTKLAG